MRRPGDRRAVGVLAALRSLSTQLSAAQLGITVTNLTIGFLAEPAIARLLEGPLETIGVSGAAVDGVAVAIALVIATAVTMVFGELVPKNLAIARPLATARSVQGFQRGFTRAMAVPAVAFNGAANAIVRRLGIEPAEELASARSPEELASPVRRSAEQGTLPAATGTLLGRSLEFGDRHALDVMTPLRRMRALDVDAPVLAVVAYLAVPSYTDVVMIACSGRQGMRPWTLLPAFDDAGGRLLLAYRRDWRASVLRDPRDMPEREVVQTLGRRHALVESSGSGTSSIAVAVPNSSETPIAGLGLRGPTEHLVPEADSLVHLLHHEATRLQGTGG